MKNIIQNKKNIFWKMIGTLVFVAIVVNFISFPTKNVDAAWGNGYLYKGTFVVQAGKVTGTQSNFTVVVAGTATGLKTVASGGHIQNTCAQTLYGLTIPADLIFTSDNAGTNVLHWQFDTYNPTTGVYSAHVLMPSIDTSTNNTLYMWYGNSSVTTCQGGVSAASWDGNTVAALATPNGATLNTSDYIGNGVTSGASAPTAGAGPNVASAGAAVFAGTGTSNLSIAGIGRRSKPYTACAFFNFTAHTTSGADQILGDSNVVADYASMGLGRTNSTGRMSTYFTDNGLTYYVADGTSVINAGTWHQACQVVSSSQISLVVDGVLEGGPNAAGIPSANALTSLSIGVAGNNTGGFWNGSIGEITVANTNRPVPWLLARYNNVINPATFWSATYDLTNGVSFTITPTVIPNTHAGNITLTLNGVGTSWVNGSTVMTASGVANVDCGAVTVNNGSLAHINCTTGAGTGTLTLTESVTGTAVSTTQVSTSSFGISPTSGAVGISPSLTLTGANTLWTQETAAGLFSVAGGTGASIGTPTITTDTAGAVALTVGSAAGALTITDTSTGKTATFTATSALPATFTASPTAVPTNNIANIIVSLNGVGTNWTNQTFTISGVAGVAKVAQNITSATTATLTITTGATSGTLTINDATDGISTTLQVGIGGGGSTSASVWVQ